jgi:4-hydroxy-3-polyprenylbenzoate decarboxylase
MLKAPNRIGMNPSIELRTGGYMHWEAWKKRGEAMPCAIVLGCPPVVSFTAVQKMPEKLDELWVSGGLVGKPLNVVRAKTVDLLVPAEAEVVIEGYVSTELLEPEAPFGESHGHVNLQEYNGYVDVTAITRRRDAVITSWVSQVTPSESSAIKRPAYEAAQIEHLRDHLGIKGVRHVATHEPLTSLHKLIVVVVERETPRTEIWRALYGTTSFQQPCGKYVIAVNPDIDPENANAVLWAMAYRANPERDIAILPHRDRGHGPKGTEEDSSLLVDATLRGPLPPVALPKREYMERARALWDELGLPALRPEPPWHGHSLGDWSEKWDEDALRAVAGGWREAGERSRQKRRRDVRPNDLLRDGEEAE